MLYIIADAGHEHYSPTIVEGPEVKDWENFCIGLSEEAVKLAAKKAPLQWTCGIRIKDALLDILETKGYSKVSPPRHILNGDFPPAFDGVDNWKNYKGTITKEAYALAVAHNASVNENRRKRREK